MSKLSYKKMSKHHVWGYVKRDEYLKQINEIIDLLEGRTDKILKDLEIQMNKASEELKFEEAAEIRDRIQAIERVSTKQKYQIYRK